MDSGRDTSVGTSARGATCKRVLLVDSIPSSLAVTEKMLLAEDYTVTAIKSGIEALSILYESEAEFDFVLTDIHLSDIEGFEFLDTLENESKILVFVLSADYCEEVVAQSLDKGVCKFYEKPFKKEFINELWQTAYSEKMKRDEDVETLQGKSPSKGDRESFKGEWTYTLHSRFLEAVTEIGLKYADGKNVLKLMNVPGLAKRDVSDHMRIYHRSLVKLEQEAFIQQTKENQAGLFSSKRMRRR